MHALGTHLPATSPMQTGTLTASGTMTTADWARSFGALLQQQRLAAGLSQKELARHAGLSQRGISDLERGARRWPYPATVRRLAAALGLDASGLAALLASTRRDTTPRVSRAEPGPLRLPVPLSSFVGRERELVEGRRLLETTRLLTLTGPGGIGKTRFAVALARGLSVDAEAAVAFVELAALADPQLLPHTVASALDVRERPDRSVTETLVDILRSKTLLLVLDNCEHLVTACAQLADTLLQGCPNLRIVTTSREVLGIDGETVWRVPPLSIPDPEQSGLPTSVLQAESVRLFVDRAASAVPDFALTDRSAGAVAQICRRLDGIPLALELAAARLRALSVEDIASRLDDRFSLLTAGSRTAVARHQTLRALVEWSYELLSLPEQQLFERLSVFAGGWTLEAAETVCSGDGVASEDVLSLLARLVDKSLVLAESQPDGTLRYRLLETLRQYAAERLLAGGVAEDARQRHAAFFADAPTIWWGPLWWNRNPVARVLQVERDYDNFRAALRQLIDRDAAARGQLLGAALVQFWDFSGRVGEGRAWLRELLEMRARPEASAARGAALVALGNLDQVHGSLASAEQALQEGLVLAREARNDAVIASALYWLAIVAWSRNDFAAGRLHAEEGLAVSRATNLRVLEGSNLLALALTADDAATVVALAEEGLAVRAQTGNQAAVAFMLSTVGRARFQQGDYGAARSLLAQALAQQFFSTSARVSTLVYSSWVSAAQGDLAQAHARSLEALALARESLGNGRLALPLEALAQVAAADGQPDRALRLAGAAAALREAHAVPRRPFETEALERWLRYSRDALGAQSSAAAFSAGNQLTTEEAVALAVDTAATHSRVATPSASTDSLGLTERETEVLRLLANGQSNRDIAAALILSVRTVERHIANLYVKLGAHGRVDATAYALRHGLA